MRGLDSIAEALFEKIRSRFPKITMGDENGAPTSEAKNARFFDFDYVVEGENQGAISISIKEPESLKLYFSQDMLENVSEGIEDTWYEFLKEMRFFAKKHMMGFDARDIAKSNLDKRDYKYLGNNTVQESAMFGTSMSSYEDLDKTRLIIRHKSPINQEQAGARTRHISSLFIENADGERFKYPYAHLAGARAMARHVANGGLPHDDFGQHIIETSSNIAKLTAFKRYVGKKDFMNTTSNDIIEGANGELDYLRGHIKKLQGQNYYVQSKENYQPTEGDVELGEDVVNDLTNAFTIPQFNEDLTDMFPLLHSIHQKRISETSVDLDDFANEGFDPEHFDGEFDMEVGGDDGEEETIYVSYTATVINGKPVVHPKSLSATSAESNPSARVDDGWADEMVSQGGNEHAEALELAQQDADEQWANRDDKYAHGESVDEDHYPHDSNFQDLYGIDDIALYREMADDAQDMDIHQFHDTYSSVIDNAEDFWEDHQEDDDIGQYDENAFETWAQSVIDEALDKGRIQALNKLVSQEFPVGVDATNALESLKGIIDDPSLSSELKELADNNPDASAKPVIYRYIKQTQPDVLDKIDFGDMKEDDTTDVVIGKDGAMKLAGQDDKEGIKDKKASTEEIVEFVRSFYDKEAGAFPKGETGVVISARKKFGDSVGDLVERFVKKLTGKEVNVDTDVKEEAGDLELIKPMVNMKGEVLKKYGTMIIKKYPHLEKTVKAMMGEGVEMCPTECCGKPVTECKCGPECPHCDCYEKNKAMKEDAEKKDKEKDNEGFTDKQIKMAYGILNDKRYKGGNLTAAADAIEKIAKGLTKHKGVSNAMRATSESAELDRIKKLSGL